MFFIKLICLTFYYNNKLINTHQEIYSRINPLQNYQIMSNLPQQFIYQRIQLFDTKNQNITQQNNLNMCKGFAQIKQARQNSQSIGERFPKSQKSFQYQQKSQPQIHQYIKEKENQSLTIISKKQSFSLLYYALFILIMFYQVQKIYVQALNYKEVATQDSSVWKIKLSADSKIFYVFYYQNLIKIYNFNNSNLVKKQEIQTGLIISGQINEDALQIWNNGSKIFMAGSFFDQKDGFSYYILVYEYDPEKEVYKTNHSEYFNISIGNIDHVQALGVNKKGDQLLVKVQGQKDLRQYLFDGKSWNLSPQNITLYSKTIDINLLQFAQQDTRLVIYDKTNGLIDIFSVQNDTYTKILTFSVKISASSPGSCKLSYDQIFISCFYDLGHRYNNFMIKWYNNTYLNLNKPGYNSSFVASDLFMDINRIYSVLDLNAHKLIQYQLDISNSSFQYTQLASVDFPYKMQPEMMASQLSSQFQLVYATDESTNKIYLINKQLNYVEAADLGNGYDLKYLKISSDYKTVYTFYNYYFRVYDFSNLSLSLKQSIETGLQIGMSNQDVIQIWNDGAKVFIAGYINSYRGILVYHYDPIIGSYKNNSEEYFNISMDTDKSVTAIQVNAKGDVIFVKLWSQRNLRRYIYNGTSWSLSSQDLIIYSINTEIQLIQLIDTQKKLLIYDSYNGIIDVFSTYNFTYIKILTFSVKLYDMSPSQCKLSNNQNFISCFRTNNHQFNNYMMNWSSNTYFNLSKEGDSTNFNAADLFFDQNMVYTALDMKTNRVVRYQLSISNSSFQYTLIGTITLPSNMYPFSIQSQSQSKFQFVYVSDFSKTFKIYLVNNQCDSIMQNCVSCQSGNKNKCIFCSPQYQLQNGTCLNCSSGYYKNNLTCSKCEILFCNECTSSTCSQCKVGYVLQNNTCSLCTSGYYKWNNMCLKCPRQCLSCADGNLTKCTQCLSGYYKQNDTCVLCSLQLIGCQNCTSNEVCLQCDIQNYFVLNQTGQKCQCIKSAYFSSLNKSCILCKNKIPKCLQCLNSISYLISQQKDRFYQSDEVTCIRCDGNYIYNSDNNSCICPDNDYQVTETGQCVKKQQEQNQWVTYLEMGGGGFVFLIIISVTGYCIRKKRKGRKQKKLKEYEQKNDYLEQSLIKQKGQSKMRIPLHNQVLNEDIFNLLKQSLLSQKSSNKVLIQEQNEVYQKRKSIKEKGNKKDNGIIQIKRESQKHIPIRSKYKSSLIYPQQSTDSNKLKRLLSNRQQININNVLLRQGSQTSQTLLPYKEYQQIISSKDNFKQSQIKKPLFKRLESKGQQKKQYIYQKEQQYQRSYNPSQLPGRKMLKQERSQLKSSDVRKNYAKVENYAKPEKSKIILQKQSLQNFLQKQKQKRSRIQQKQPTIKQEFMSDAEIQSRRDQLKDE